MVYNPVSHYLHIDVLYVPPSIMEDIMGYKGAYFKAFTQAMKLLFTCGGTRRTTSSNCGDLTNTCLEPQSVMFQRIEELVPMTCVELESVEHPVT